MFVCFKSKGRNINLPVTGLLKKSGLDSQKPRSRNSLSVLDIVGNHVAAEDLGSHCATHSYVLFPRNCNSWLVTTTLACIPLFPCYHLPCGTLTVGAEKNVPLIPHSIFIVGYPGNHLCSFVGINERTVGLFSFRSWYFPELFIPGVV